MSNREIEHPIKTEFPQMSKEKFDKLREEFWGPEMSIQGKNGLATIMSAGEKALFGFIDRFSAKCPNSYDLKHGVLFGYWVLAMLPLPTIRIKTVLGFEKRLENDGEFRGKLFVTLPDGDIGDDHLMRWTNTQPIYIRMGARIVRELKYQQFEINSSKKK